MNYVIIIQFQFVYIYYIKIINSSTYNDDDIIKYKPSFGKKWSYISDRQYLMENMNDNIYKMTVTKGPNLVFKILYYRINL